MSRSKPIKEEVQEIINTFDEVFSALSKAKRLEFLGHANDVFLFLEAAKRAAPEKES